MALWEGTRSEVHPRLYWLAGSLINLGTFLLFLKEKLYHSSLMIKTDHDRLFPEFPSFTRTTPRQQLREQFSLQVSLGSISLQSISAPCPPYATSTTTTRRRTAATTASSPVCVWHGPQGRWTVVNQVVNVRGALCAGAHGSQICAQLHMAPRRKG